MKFPWISSVCLAVCLAVFPCRAHEQDGKDARSQSSAEVMSGQVETIQAHLGMKAQHKELHEKFNALHSAWHEGQKAQRKDLKAEHRALHEDLNALHQAWHEENRGKVEEEAEAEHQVLHEKLNALHRAFHDEQKTQHKDLKAEHQALHEDLNALHRAFHEEQQVEGQALREERAAKPQDQMDYREVHRGKKAGRREAE